MKILVTGGAGFIGSHLVDALISEHNVTVYDSFEPQVHKNEPAYLNKNAKLIRADVRDKEKLKNAISDADVVFHEAAMVSVTQSMYQIEKYMDVNTIGTSKLLEILAGEEHDVKKLIVASSYCIYGEGKYECSDCGIVYPTLRSEETLRNKEWEMKCPHCNKPVKPVPTDEKSNINPTSVYAISKRTQEEMCLIVGEAYGIPTVALRYFNTYGTRQSLSNPYNGVCAIFSSRIKNDNPPIAFEDGLQSRDFVSVHDIVKANILVMERAKADYEVFNVGTGKPTTVLDIANTLLNLYGKLLRPEIVNKYRVGDIRHCYADISKIKKLGFKPGTSLKNGMNELVDWGRTEIAEDKYESAYQELKVRGLVDNDCICKSRKLYPLVSQSRSSIGKTMVSIHPRLKRRWGS